MVTLGIHWDLGFILTDECELSSTQSKLFKSSFVIAHFHDCSSFGLGMWTVFDTSRTARKCTPIVHQHDWKIFAPYSILTALPTRQLLNDVKLWGTILLQSYWKTTLGTRFWSLLQISFYAVKKEVAIQMTPQEDKTFDKFRQNLHI